MKTQLLALSLAFAAFEGRPVVINIDPILTDNDTLVFDVHWGGPPNLHYWGGTFSEAAWLEPYFMLGYRDDGSHLQIFGGAFGPDVTLVVPSFGFGFADCIMNPSGGEYYPGMPGPICDRSFANTIGLPETAFPLHNDSYGARFVFGPLPNVTVPEDGATLILLALGVGVLAVKGRRTERTAFRHPSPE
jgi:hypothetical protein